jgi:xanthine dehydrogenase YagS FAD-binding subunit
MKNFEYVRVGSLQEAIESARPASTQYIAGGTELLNWMRLGIAAPDRVVDIGALNAQRDIRRRGSELTIGALATLNEIGEHPLIRQHAAVLGDACLKAASAQIRNRATIGGNILQKTRCTYFRSEAPVPWPCNKRAPGSGCAALAGLNERHAILGWTDACVAVHPSDPAVALACLDAQVDLSGPRGRRTVAVTALLLTQEEARQERSRSKTGLHEALLESRLQPGEIITTYRIPIVADERSAYVKVRERESYEYALVSSAAALVVKDGRIQRVRIALGSVAQKPWRLTAAEQSLVGAALTRDAVLPAIHASLSGAKPLEHNAYKIEMAANAAARALAIAGGFA